ncbi:MAG: hypothetical protein WAU41_15030 [Gaiellaceae bacterium]
MTKQLARLYVLVAGVFAFFVFWAGVAAHPWAATPAQDPRVAALVARQQQVQRDSIRVKRIVDARWARYQKQITARNTAAAQQVTAVAAQPAVRVVNLPPLVVTRTS